MTNNHPIYKTFDALVTAAMALGYALSKWTKHQGHTCPVCGTKVGIFYHIKDRRRPKVAACHSCGWRKRIWPADDKDIKQTMKVVSEVRRCRATTKKGRRCKRIATNGDYCPTHSH